MYNREIQEFKRKKKKTILYHLQYSKCQCKYTVAVECHELDGRSVIRFLGNKTKTL